MHFFRKPERRSLRLAHLPASQDYQLPEESKLTPVEHETNFKDKSKCVYILKRDLVTR